MLETELTSRSMGGGLRVMVASRLADGDRADRDLRRVAGRIDAWAQRLTRFSIHSDLGRLNADAHRSPAPLRPTIASVLSHARTMSRATDGSVDVSMLDLRIAAEAGTGPTPSGGPSAWRLIGEGRRQALVRDRRVRFDLDGVAKGWIADRALRLLDGYPGALVDADGDLAVRPPSSAAWGVAVAHPHEYLDDLALVRLPRDWPAPEFGVATSGTSVHRWHGRNGPTHHLIDPLTARPAVTDVVQVTVVARSAGLAEALAKTAVIRGSHGGLAFLERERAWAALVLLENGELLTTAGTSRWMA